MEYCPNCSEYLLEGLESYSLFPLIYTNGFLAVQDSSISDIVGRSVGLSEPTNNQSRAEQSRAEQSSDLDLGLG